MKILAVCGSLQAKSANRGLLESLGRLFPDGVVTQFEGLDQLPYFNPDREGDTAVEAWRAALSGCDAVVVACPEYGHSLPGVLKNAIDWVIGTGELEEKIVAITASTPSPERGLKGLAALKTTLGAVRARVVGGVPVVRGLEEQAQLVVLKEGIIQAIEERAAR